MLDELYDYVLPYRKPATQPVHGSEKRVEKIYDATATKAAFRFAGRMQQDVTPSFQKFFELKTGPYLEKTGDEKKEIEEQLETVSKKIAAVLEGANFAVASGEMYLDLFGGTAALLMLPDKQDIVSFTAVPVAEIALSEDGRGKVNAVYWEKQFDASDVEGLWPETKMSPELKKLVEDSPAEPVTIVQASEFNRTTGQWNFTAWRKGKLKDEGPLYEIAEKTCPWLTPRFYKVPGEPMGRGPGSMGLPTAKTLNKVTELTLKAAAFAILGLWMVKNDRVFNPKTARMVPGAMWKVASTGGTMGASIAKLEVPGRFDISNIILQDLREALKQMMLDDTLPPDSGAVRSATEIVERMKRLSADLSGAYARLVLEIIRPLIQRVIDILDRFKLIESPLTIDQLLFKVEVTSPIAKMQQAQDVSSLVEWLQMILSLGGPQMMMMSAKIEDIFGDMGRKLGISEKYIRSEADKKKIQQMVAALIAQAQQPAQAAAGLGAGAGDPSQQQSAPAMAG
nr:portal protein [Jiella avicenniae]